MKYRLHILFLTTYYLLLVTFAHAQDSKSLFQSANEYYKTKQYEEAEKMYLLLLKKDKLNANAFYNLGNTYFHLKQYANAVLYYEKAKKIQPDNKQIQHNIELTNNKLFSKIEYLMINYYNDVGLIVPVVIHIYKYFRKLFNNKLNYSIICIQND